MRRRINLNREWRFTRGDPPGAHSPAFDDSAWDRVGLPHTFDLPYFRTPEFYVGTGWYRKRITTAGLFPPKGPVPFLEFDGAFQVATVYVNGEPAGEHRGGYSGFQIPLPRREPNASDLLIAVRVNNEWDPRLAPRAGEHIFSGGLYRDVRLVVRGGWIAWNGVSVTTPHVSRDSAVVRVRTAVRNPSAVAIRCLLRQTILDPDGTPVTSFESLNRIDAGATAEFDQTSEPIARPKLWHPDHPHLYAVRTQVFDHDEPADEVTSPLGFRWFQWTPDRGFFLNGERLYLRGANAHHDRAGWGIAATRAGCERDVRLIKEAGFNFVRGSHYPHHPAFADACDRLGLLFLPELCFWGKGGFGPEGYWNASAFPANPDDWQPFADHCKQTLREMIRADRNHPSIVAWSLTNEAFFTYHVEQARSLVSDLVALSHDLDPTRPAAIGGAQRGGFDRLGDIAAYNGDGARLFIDPGVPNLVSEYGAISKPPDAFEPFWGELQPEPFPWRAGQAIWCAFDYGTIAGKQGLKGICDHARLPKRSWHWYRRHHLDIDPPPRPADTEPAQLRLATDAALLATCDGTDDCQLVVTVHDAFGRRVRACPPVTLTIVSGPGEFPTGRSITFDPATDIPITEGQAAIEFRSYWAGRTVIRATSPGLEPAEVRIVTMGEPVYEEGVTPETPDRPYVPPKLSEQAVRSLASVVNVAKDRPTRAGSETAAHPARHANDGDPSTFWAPGAGDAWWQVDLEGFYQLASLRIAFPTAANHRFIVETSRDGADWDPAVDRRSSVRTDAVRNDVLPPGCVARHVRVTLSAPAAGIAEVELHGVLSVR